MLEDLLERPDFMRRVYRGNGINSKADPRRVMTQMECPKDTLWALHHEAFEVEFLDIPKLLARYESDSVALLVLGARLDLGV